VIMIPTTSLDYRNASQVWRVQWVPHWRASPSVMGYQENSSALVAVLLVMQSRRPPSVMGYQENSSALAAVLLVMQSLRPIVPVHPIEAEY